MEKLTSLRNPRSLWGYAAATAIVLVATGVTDVLYRITHTSRLAAAFLVAVAITAYLLGSGPAFFAAGLGFVIYNSYLAAPRVGFSFGSVESIVALTSFVVIAMTTGSLTGRVRDEARRAKTRALTTSVLFDATRDFSASSDEDLIRQRLAQHLSAAAKGRAVALYGNQVIASPADPSIGADDLPSTAGLEPRLADGAVATTVVDGWMVRPLCADGAALGFAAWRPEHGVVLAAEEQTLLEILADAGAAAIVRARLAAAKANAEAQVRTEQLRNALLSSISHDLRTPLAAIMASASSLQEFGEGFDAATRHDLTLTIQEEAQRLNASVANLLNMTKLEAGALVAQRAPFSIAEVIDRTARRNEVAHRRAVVTRPLSPDLEAAGDPVLFEQALGNVVENAIRYSPPGSRVHIACECRAGVVHVSVSDEGAGVPSADLARIFDKFYRSPGATASGTGLGLSITKGFMEAMGGVVTAQNSQRPDRGLIVTLKLAAA